MKRILSFGLVLCILLSCAVFFTGCSTESTKDWPVVYGNVTIDKEPQNVVVLDPVLADIISYIGYDIKLVGRSDECDQDFLYIVPAVGSAAAPDTAAIAAAQADLVITNDTLSADAKSAIEANGAKVVTMQTPSSEEELKQLYVDLGTVLGGSTTGSAKGEEGYEELLSMLGTLNTASSDIVCTVAYLYMNENNELCTFVKGTLPFKFFNYNGNANVFANQQEPQVNTMELRIGSPDYIFYDSDEVLQYIATDESLTKLKAVTNGRTYQISKKAFERFGSSAEAAVFEMLHYIEQDSKATADEAETVAEAPTAVPATTADDAVQEEAEAAVEETAAPVAEEAEEENVITYSAQNEITEY